MTYKNRKTTQNKKKKKLKKMMEVNEIKDTLNGVPCPWSLTEYLKDQ
jgi:hypothetical protein